MPITLAALYYLFVQQNWANLTAAENQLLAQARQALGNDDINKRLDDAASQMQDEAANGDALRLLLEYAYCLVTEQTIKILKKPINITQPNGNTTQRAGYDESQLAPYWGFDITPNNDNLAWKLICWKRTNNLAPADMDAYLRSYCLSTLATPVGNVCLECAKEFCRQLLSTYAPNANGFRPYAQAGPIYAWRNAFYDFKKTYYDQCETSLATPTVGDEGQEITTLAEVVKETRYPQRRPALGAKLSSDPKLLSPLTWQRYGRNALQYAQNPDADVEEHVAEHWPPQRDTATPFDFWNVGGELMNAIAPKNNNNLP